ncbi:MAG: TlpA family protein disulfide reductase [Clostridiales bacterium]|nr:TlpA family protein disulfide reductase [Clostridiales bacterium]
MNNKKVLLAVALVFVLVLGGAYVLYDRLGQEMKPDQLVASQPQSTSSALAEEASEQPAGDGHNHAEGEEVYHAPDVTLYNESGETVQLSDYFGKPIVLNFWASWCGPCQSEMPDFNEKYLEIGDDVHFLMVNLTDGSRETIETATAFIDKNGYAFPVFYDTTGEAATAYAAYSLPTTYFIDAYGHAVAQAIGAIDMATLEQGLSMIGR